MILADHKPLTYPFQQALDRHSPRELRQLYDIVQFTSAIHYLSGTGNTVADGISRIHITAVSAFNLEEIAGEQLHDDELLSL